MSTFSGARPTKYMMSHAEKLLFDALRSDKYTQGQGKLSYRNPDNGSVSHCCLGVACEVYLEHHPDELVIYDIDNIRVYDGTPYELPTKVREWLGWDNSDGKLVEPIGYVTSLVRLNDMGTPFAVIAEFIANGSIKRKESQPSESELNNVTVRSGQETGMHAPTSDVANP